MLEIKTFFNFLTPLKAIKFDENKTSTKLENEKVKEFKKNSLLSDAKSFIFLLETQN